MQKSAYLFGKTLSNVCGVYRMKQSRVQIINDSHTTSVFAKYLSKTKLRMALWHICSMGIEIGWETLIHVIEARLRTH